MTFKKLLVALFPILLMLLMTLVFVLYNRTGYFKNSVSTQKRTFKCDTKDSITSFKYYRDLSGNWILLDKGIIIKDGETGIICVKSNIEVK